jgi:beta-xylosidase
MNTENKFMNGNPIIKHKFTADPTAISHDNKIYLYTGHDDPPPQVDDYVMNEWLCFSSPDLASWEEHPVSLNPSSFTWAKGDAFASSILFHANKFFWYVAVSHADIPGKSIGVAVSDHPTGPFTDAIGKAMITQDMIPDQQHLLANLDPTVLVDEDGTGHIFWGHSKCYYAALKSNMLELDSPVMTLDLPGFQEGAHIHKRNGWFYLSYGFEFPEKVAYAMSRNIKGPWEFKGILNDIPENCQTNRAAIIEFRNQSYFFYHNGALPNGGSHRRSVCVDYLHYDADDTMQRIIMSSEGVKKV